MNKLKDLSQLVRPFTEEQLLPKKFIESPDYEGDFADLLSSRDSEINTRYTMTEIKSAMSRAIDSYNELSGKEVGKESLTALTMAEL